MPWWSPCRCRFDFVPSRASYRTAMPGDATATPIVPPSPSPRPTGASTRPSPSVPRSTPGGPKAAGRSAETALLDERRLLTADELSALAELPDQWVTSLAALAHQVRLDWCGPEVEVEGILSAKTGGCPEDCHFCSQSSQFDTPVKATPFLDADEVLRAARGDQGRRGRPSSASCWPSAAPTSEP